MRALFPSLSLVLFLTASPSPPTTSSSAERPDEEFVCPPCGADCHERRYEAAGSCLTCGMNLVPASSIPSVAVLLYEGVDLLAATGPLGVFAASDAAFVHTVADTTDPLRAEHALTVVPDHDFASAPPAGLLVIPSGGGQPWEDELVVDFVRRAAGKADLVLGVGSGNLLLARAGVLPEPAAPLPAGLAARLGDLGIELEAVQESRLRLGDFELARDAAAALAAALDLTEELAGPARRERAVRVTGFGGGTDR